MARRTLAEAIREQHEQLARTAQARIEKGGLKGKVTLQENGTFRLELDDVTDSMIDFLTNAVAGW